MKTLVLGDIHGRNCWETIVNQNTFEKVVFIGDYFDSRDRNITPKIEIDNFKRIVNFKLENFDRVILLVGNHDFHYFNFTKGRYSGYDYSKSQEVGELLHDALNKNLLQMCYVQDNFLMTHAGVTKTWCQDNNIDLTDIEHSINDLFKHRPNAFDFTIGRNWSYTGNDVCQTPIWVRPQSLEKDMIDGYVQIVGHTTEKRIVLGNDVIYIDTLGTSNEFLIIENNITTIGLDTVYLVG